MEPGKQGVNKSWRTTIAGLVAGLPIAIDALMTAYNAGTFTGKSGSQLAGAIGIVLFGLFAKDSQVTGGTIPSTPEAEARVEK
jgi:hypothetical protein